MRNEKFKEVERTSHSGDFEKEFVNLALSRSELALLKTFDTVMPERDEREGGSTSVLMVGIMTLVAANYSVGGEGERTPATPAPPSYSR